MRPYLPCHRLRSAQLPHQHRPIASLASTRCPELARRRRRRRFRRSGGGRDGPARNRQFTHGPKLFSLRAESNCRGASRVKVPVHPQLEKWSPAQIAEVQSHAESWSPERVLVWAFETFGKNVAISSAFGAEGMVLIDMASRINQDFQLFT